MINPSIARGIFFPGKNKKLKNIKKQKIKCKTFQQKKPSRKKEIIQK